MLPTPTRPEAGSAAWVVEPTWTVFAVHPQQVAGALQPQVVGRAVRDLRRARQIEHLRHGPVHDLEDAVVAVELFSASDTNQ